VVRAAAEERAQAASPREAGPAVEQEPWLAV